MRKFWIGTAAYVLTVSGIVWGAYEGFNALIGMPVKASAQAVAQIAPVQRTSGKWTPVEIKREPTASVAPPLPLYVPRTAAAIKAAPKQPGIVVAERKLTKKKVVIARRDYAPQETRQVFAYAPPEQPRFFGPFRFGF